MSAVPGFTPGGNFSIVVTNAGTDRVNITGQGTTLRIANVGATECFLTFGTSSTLTAATTDFSMPATSQLLVTVPSTTTYVAAVTAAGTTTLRISRGDGGI